MAGSNENSIAAIGGRHVTTRVAQHDQIERPMVEQKTEEMKKAEQVDRKITEPETTEDSSSAKKELFRDPSRFYNVQFDPKISKLFTEVIDRETDNVVFRIPAGVAQEAYDKVKRPRESGEDKGEIKV